MPNSCPICHRQPVVSKYDPFDGYQGDLSVYRIGCRECKLYVEDKNATIAKEKWNSLISRSYAPYESIERIILKCNELESITIDNKEDIKTVRVAVGLLRRILR